MEKDEPCEEPIVPPKPRKSTATKLKDGYGPSLKQLILTAVSASVDRHGVSFYALKMALAAAGYDVDSNNHVIKKSVSSLVKHGVLLQTHGTGCNGSYKVNKAALKPKKTEEKKKKTTEEKKKKKTTEEKKAPKKAAKKKKTA